MGSVILQTIFLTKFETIRNDDWEILEVLDVFGPHRQRIMEPEVLVTLRRKGKL